MLNLGLSICSPAVWMNGIFVPSSAATATLLAALSGSYSKSLKQAWDDAIGASEADGSWADFDVLYPIGAIPGTASANADDSRINWKNPGTFNLAAVNSPTHGNGYWQGDGSSSRLRTGYTPSTHGVKYLQDDASLWMWSLTSDLLTIVDIGNSQLSPFSLVWCRFTGDIVIGRVNNSTNVVGSSITDGSGLICVQRRGAIDARIFKNGTQLGTNATASVGRPTQEQWICGANNASFSTRKTCFAAWGASQAGRESAIHSRWQTVFSAAGTI
jgi:hypothetical protein